MVGPGVEGVTGHFMASWFRSQHLRAAAEQEKLPAGMEDSEQLPGFCFRFRCLFVC